MTQKYQVKVSMKQAAIVETGIVLKQGDFGMQIEIEVLDFDATGTTPQIVFRKAMGAVESTTITVSSNKYTYTFKGTELDTPGKVFCDLKLKNSTTQRISTASFMFRVVADTLDGLAEESSSYSDTIEQLLADVVHLSDTPGLVKNDGSINTTIEKDADELKSASKYTGYNPELRNGTPTNVQNAKQVGTAQIIPYGESSSITLLINKSVRAEGNYWRLVFDTFTVDNGKPENHINDRVTSQKVIDASKVTIYPGFFDSTSKGFAFSIAEKMPGGDIETLRITDFDPGDVVIINNYTDRVDERIDYFSDASNAVIVKTNLRNGTSSTPSNTQQVCTGQIIPFGTENYIRVKINKAVSATGNFWRLIFNTYSVDSGKPENNINNIISNNVVIDKDNVVISKGYFDNNSVGFSVALAEMTANSQVVSHRIEDFGGEDISIVRTDLYVANEIDSRLRNIISPLKIVNGTVSNPANPNQVSINSIIPFEKNTRYIVLINRPVSTDGNYYRLVISTYNVKEGVPTTKVANLIAKDRPIDMNPAEIYENMFDSRAVGFSFSIAEKTAAGTVLTLREGDFSQNDVIVIKQRGGIPGNYSYTGQRIELQQHSFNFQNAFKAIKPESYSARGWQGHSIYNDVLIRLLDKGIAIAYDVSSAIPNEALPKLAEFNLGSYGDTNHANNCNFSRIFYNENPDFPLLYLTDGNDANTFKCSVENITREGDTFSSTLIQTIQLDQTGFENFGFEKYWGWPAWIVDENKALYVFGTKYRTTDADAEYAGRNKYIITKFAIPDLANSSVTLTKDDVIEQWTSPYDVKYTQGGTIVGDYLIYVFGLGTSQYPTIIKVFSLSQKTAVATIPLSNTEYGQVEPEDLCEYKNGLIVGFATDLMYRISFPY